LKRRFSVHVNVELPIRVGMKAKGRRQGRGKPFVEIESRDDLHRKSGIWMKLERLIDRANDWYHERVRDPLTGQTVHECAEPLSEHQGHGAAKRLRPEGDPASEA
jgi:hypothetical protein